MRTPNQISKPTDAFSIPALGQESKARRYDIDWLRVLGIGTVFLFHCGKLFDQDYWHVKNAEISQFATIAISSVAQWLMPLFFVLSGISTYCSLNRQAPGQFVVARIKRLVIPLVFGTFIVILGSGVKSHCGSGFGPDLTGL